MKEIKLLPCPFCAAVMIVGKDELGEFVAHPPMENGETKESDNCIIHYGRFDLKAWNTRSGCTKEGDCGTPKE